MKLAKLSLAAIVVAGLASSSFAADNLADAFKEGKVDGELRAYYFDKDKNNHREDLFTMGAILGYKTASLYGLSAGLTFQGNSSPFANGDINAHTGAKGMFSGDEYGTGAVLSEAYVAYKIGKTNVQVGRMFIDTPLVSSSGGRMTKEAFEGATIVNTDLSNTTLIAGYVQKFQSRTDDEGHVGKFTKSFAFGSDGGADLDHGAYTLAVINKSVPGLTLTGAYAYANSYVEGASSVLIDGGVNIGYVEALYEGKAGEIGYVLGAQDYYNKMQTVANGYDDSINVYALKAGLSFKGIHGTVAFSQVTDKNIPGGVVVSGLGNGADLLYTDSVISNPGYTPDTKTYMVDLNYDLTAAANVGARYTYADGKNESYKDEKDAFTSVYGYYKFDSVLKGLKLGAEYEDKSKDASGDTLWVKANYKF